MTGQYFISVQFAQNNWDQKHCWRSIQTVIESSSVDCVTWLLKKRAAYWSILCSTGFPKLSKWKRSSRMCHIHRTNLKSRFRMTGRLMTKTKWNSCWNSYMLKIPSAKLKRERTRILRKKAWRELSKNQLQRLTLMWNCIVLKVKTLLGKFREKWMKPPFC